MKRVLLLDPPFGFIYSATKVHKQGVPFSPSLTLAVLASPLIKAGAEVRVLDLNLESRPTERLREELSIFSPDYVGITFTTPLYCEVKEYVQLIKEYDSGVVVIGGGPHASSLPEETLSELDFDIVVLGEGDFILPEIILSKELSSVKGICYIENGKIRKNPRREFIDNLDNLPFPCWQLYDLEKYNTSELLSLKNPAGYLETSRGCPYRCVYCNKSVFGQNFRVKSPKRVVDEIVYMLEVGFREIHIIDDNFSTDLERAKEICREIKRRRLDFPWAPLSGIRVDRVDQELLRLMREAGCYRVYYGVESGNQGILDRAGKGITLDQIKNGVKWAKKAGLEVYGFFMLGLPGETKETMQQTIDFAIKLDLDMAKTTITTPLPGTPLFRELEEGRFIKSKEWSKLNLYAPSPDLFCHPDLSWDVIEYYFRKFYRSFYLRPSFIFKRFKEGLKKGKILSDAKHFLRAWRGL